MYGQEFIVSSNLSWIFKRYIMQYYATIPVCIFAISGSTLKVLVMELEVLILIHHTVMHYHLRFLSFKLLLALM